MTTSSVDQGFELYFAEVDFSSAKDLHGKAWLAAMNGKIWNALKSGAITYDRSSVLRDGYADVADGEDGRKVVTIPSLEAVEEEYVQNPINEFHATCRELAQQLKAKLKMDGAVDNVEVFGCAGNGEAHYILILTKDGKDYLMDVGYSQPVPVLVPLDGKPAVSSFYPEVSEGSAQIYGGRTRYSAARDGEGQDARVGFVIIQGDSVQKSFTFKRMTPELDKQIVATWLKATGKAYSTSVDESQRLVRQAIDNPRAGLFMELHKHVDTGVKAGKELGELIEVQYR